MDDDDIYGSILSDPKSTSNSNKYSDQYSETNLQQQHPQSASYTQGQFNTAPVPPQPSLFISNLTWWTSEDDLRQILGDLSNRIKELQFLENKPNGKSKGMVIVEFVDVATAEVAMSILEGREISGRVCEVTFARNPPMKPYERGAVGARGDRPNPRQHYRLDQQYHQNYHQRQGYEITYHQQQDDYGHGPSSRHVHRDESVGTTSGYDNRVNDTRGYDNRVNDTRGYDNRGSSSSTSRYRETRSRDDRSRSPDRRSSNKSRRY